MINHTLDQEELEIMEAFESGKIQPIPNAKEEIEKHKGYAAYTLNKENKNAISP